MPGGVKNGPTALHMWGRELKPGKSRTPGAWVRAAAVSLGCTGKPLQSPGTTLLQWMELGNPKPRALYCIFLFLELR